MLLGFNPRARDGREKLPESQQAAMDSFNPRARDGRELADKKVNMTRPVSIHAPVMDANINGLLMLVICKFQSTRP